MIIDEAGSWVGGRVLHIHLTAARRNTYRVLCLSRSEKLHEPMFQFLWPDVSAMLVCVTHTIRGPLYNGANGFWPNTVEIHL